MGSRQLLDHRSRSDIDRDFSNLNLDFGDKQSQQSVNSYADVLSFAAGITRYTSQCGSF